MFRHPCVLIRLQTIPTTKNIRTRNTCEQVVFSVYLKSALFCDLNLISGPSPFLSLVVLHCRDVLLVVVLGNFLTVPVTFLNIHALLCLIGSRVQAHAHVYLSPGGVEGLRNTDMFSCILLQGMSTESSNHLLSPDIVVVKNSFGGEEVLLSLV